MSRCLCCGLAEESGKRFHARCARRVFGSSRIPFVGYTMKDLNELAARNVVNRISVPGVQPKLSIHLERMSGREPRMTIVGLEGDYILKPQTIDYPFMPEAEHFAMSLARRCGIRTADFSLIPLASGELAYITARMDRPRKGGIRHMIDFAQLTEHTTEQKYNGSMEQVAKAVARHSSCAGLDLVRLLELTVFCWLTGNSDMHLKNFSLIHDEARDYQLADAYDLLPVKLLLPADRDELALTLAGKRSNLAARHFTGYGMAMGFSEGQSARLVAHLVRRVETNLDTALSCSFLPDGMRREVGRFVRAQIARMTKDLKGE